MPESDFVVLPGLLLGTPWQLRTMRSAFSAQGSRSGSRHHAYSPTESSSVREPLIYHGKMHTNPEGSTPIDIMFSVSAEIVHALTVVQNKLVFQSPIGVMKEIVWDYSEKSVQFVLDDGATSPIFVFPVLTELEAHFTVILALPDVENPPEQLYIGVLIGHNLPSPIQQRRVSTGSSPSTPLSMAKRQELLRREQPVRSAASRERLGLEYIRSGFLCFTCSIINGDLRGLTLGDHHIRVFPSPDCHDRSACLFTYSYDQLETCEAAGTRLELRFRTTHHLAKQPSCLAFQSLESHYIREAIWYLKNGTYMDAYIREMLGSPTRTPRSSNSDQTPDIASPRRANASTFFDDSDNLTQRIDACCRVIGCENLVECIDQSCSKQDETSTSNVMVHINSGELSHMNPTRLQTNGLCNFHASCLASTASNSPSRQISILSRDKSPFPGKSVRSLIALLQSTHYAKMFKFQGQLLKRQNGRTFHLRKTWHPKFAVLFETPVGGFLCYYDKVTHCPGMTDTPKERRVIDLSSVLCIRPVSSASPVKGNSNVGSPTMHAFDVVTLYRTWTFASSEPIQYQAWLHVLTECVEKHATIAPDRIQRFPVKLAMTGQSCPSEATLLEISSHGVVFCTGHEGEVVLSSWYYTDLEKWSVVYQQGYTCCLLKCRSAVPTPPGSPRSSAGDTVTQDYLFRTAEASSVCLAIEFYVGKCMAKLEVLAGQYLEESRAQVRKRSLHGDQMTTKRDAAAPKLLPVVREHPIETVSLGPVGSPEGPAAVVAETATVPNPVSTTKEQVLVNPAFLKVDESPRKVETNTPAMSAPMGAFVTETTTKDGSVNDKPPLILEKPPQGSCDEAACEKQSPPKKEYAIAMVSVELRAATSHIALTDDQVGTSLQDLVAVAGQSLGFESETEHDTGIGEFESIDLGEAVVAVSRVPEAQESEYGEPESIGHKATYSSSLSLPLATGESHDVQSCLTARECKVVEPCQQEQCTPKNIFYVHDEERCCQPPIDSSTSDVLMVESCTEAVSSTQESCSNGIRISPSNEVSSDLLQTGKASPLLLLEYDPSWPGEPSQRDNKEVELPMVSLDHEQEDDRKSECDGSDMSDAFNSCASEAELVPDTANSDVQSCGNGDIYPPLTGGDCSNEVFEDAIDPPQNLEIELRMPLTQW